jgi:hypothetical protein
MLDPGILGVLVANTKDPNLVFHPKLETGENRVFLVTVFVRPEIVF